MAEFKDERFCIPPGLTAVQIKQVCVQLYRMLAKRDLGSMVHDFAKRMSLTPSAVKISNSKARWGSCSVRRNLNFSWRLIMADDEVIEYIIVHELAHIAELNHSTRFWSIVESAIPDYKAREKRLKELYEKLCAENW
jgi:predicted metal-dependent hydrolase